MYGMCKRVSCSDGKERRWHDAHKTSTVQACLRVVFQADCTGFEGAPSLRPTGAALIAGAVAARTRACGKYQQMSVIGQVQGQPDLVLHFASPQVGSGMESLAMHAECHLQDSHWQADGLRNRWVVLES